MASAAQAATEGSPASVIEAETAFSTPAAEHWRKAADEVLVGRAGMELHGRPKPPYSSQESAAPFSSSRSGRPLENNEAAVL